MKKETIKAFTNVEKISLSIVGDLKDNGNTSLTFGDYKLVNIAVAETIRILGKNDLLTNDVEDVLN
tara:strand:- start:322 stop:519 length:198 start_codon:yes stop_codon:yes gene_type:complete